MTKDPPPARGQCTRAEARAVIRLRRLYVRAFAACTWATHMSRVGQQRIYAPYMTVCIFVDLPAS